MNKCQECDDGSPDVPEAAHPDPRDPPLDTGEKVLCDDCHDGAVEDCIADAEDELRRVRLLKRGPLRAKRVTK